MLANPWVEMSLKLSFCARLPWALAGVAHHESSVVKAVALHCLKVYDSMDCAVRACLPEVVHSFLSVGGPWRSEMEMVAKDGCPLARSSSFLGSVASLRFCPLSERIIEAGHKAIKTPHGFTKFGAASASSALRTYPLLVQPLLANPDFFSAVADALQSCQNPSAAVEFFHMSRHPQLQVKSNHVKMLHMTAQVVYRCDAASTFADLKHIRREHGKQMLTLEGEAAKALRAQEPLSMGALLRHFVADHCQVMELLVCNHSVKCQTQWHQHRSRFPCS